VTSLYRITPGAWEGIRPSALHAPVPADDPAWKLVGRVLGGRFQIDGVIARGGMGTLLAGHDERREQPVVVKIVGLVPRSDRRANERLLREARLACRVMHPSIVRVLDLGMLETNEPYLVMERLVGEDVASLARRRPVFSIDEVMSVARSIGDALAELHAAQIVHRDVKTENLFVLADPSLEPRIKLIDFGLAILDDASMTRITGSGHLMGTAEYIAPECVRGARASTASDVYALATALFEMLAGRTPFVGGQLEVLLQKSREDAPRLSSCGRRLPHLDPVFAHALDREPDRRPNVLTFVEELAAAL
jgi:serine/threonine protein kinase